MVLRPNYLEGWAWGRRPVVRARRRRALWAYLGPGVSYLGFVLVAGALCSLVYFIGDADENGGVPVPTVNVMFWVLWLGFSVWVGGVYCSILPFLTENRFGNARMLQANCHDYRLAGFTGREMLAGVAAPQLAGIRLFVRIYASTVTLIFVAGVCFNPGMFMAAFALVLAFAFVVNLYCGVYYHVALWTKYAGKAQRLMMTAVLVFSSPLAVIAVFGPVLGLLPNVFVVLLGFAMLGELIGFFVRPVVAANSWREAKERLDGNKEMITPVEGLGGSKPAGAGHGLARTTDGLARTACGERNR